MAKKIQLTADAGDEQTEIEVLDGNFDPIPLEHNMGQIDVELSPGVYAVNFRVGDTKTQKLVVLQPNSPRQYVRLDQDEQIEFSTSAPLKNTKTQVPSHSDNARRISLLAPTPAQNIQHGGSQLFIFVRNPRAEQTSDICQGISLHDHEGNLAIDFDEMGERSLEESWMGAHIELDTGAYRLRVSNKEGGFLEQMIYLCKDWQTQLFMFAMAGEPEEITYRANPFRTSLLMARSGTGFEPQREDLRWTELSLRALSEGRAIPSKTRSDMLWAKFENPMLGIYGGHLHMRRDSINTELMLTVYENLLGLVGEHPDVIALGYELARREPSLRNNASIKESLSRAGPVVLPPMLRSSWSMFMKASAEDTGIIPEGSLADKVATSIIRYGPWVIWRDSFESESIDIDMDTNATDRPTFIDDIKSRFNEFVSAVAHTSLSFLIKNVYKYCEGHPEAVDLLFTDRFTYEERRIIQYIYPKADSSLSMIAASVAGHKGFSQLTGGDVPPSAHDLIAALELPAGTALRVLWQASMKWIHRPVVPDAQTLEFFVARESWRNPAMENALWQLESLHTGIVNTESGHEINGLEFAYIRYRNPPTGIVRKTPTRADLVMALKRDHYQFDHQPVSQIAITRILKQVRTELTVLIDAEIKAGNLSFSEDWQNKVLPRADKTQPGQLLPEPLSHSE